MGKTIVITGASSGFGRGTALALGQLRVNVVVPDRRTALLEEVASQIRQAGGKALEVTADVITHGANPGLVSHLTQ